MKKILFITFLLCPFSKAHAQNAVIDAIKAGIKKVIVAVDLKIQRLQNQTIWLQDAQKVLENALAKAKLAEIGDWVEKQKNLYGDYFEELKKVKDVITYYHRVKDITAIETRMLANYKRAFSLFQQDDHFTPEEILYVGQVYAGMIAASARDLEQLALVVQAFTTSMTDEDRRKVIDAAYVSIQEHYRDLEEFTTENQLLSLRRAKDAQEIGVVKQLYGL